MIKVGQKKKAKYWGRKQDLDDDKEVDLDESEAVYYERYQKQLKSGESSKRLEESHDKPIPILQEYLIRPHQKIDPRKTSELEVIIKTANDERPIQEFLKNNPYFLTRKTFAHHGQICIPKPKLGAEYEPDFLIAGVDSGGLWWYGVELESPKYSMFTKKGEITSHLNHALRQIDDWRGWTRENIAYAQKQYMHIDGDLACYVLIGRRENEELTEKKLVARRREVARKDKSGLILHHYEWLLDDIPRRVRVK